MIKDNKNVLIFFLLIIAILFISLISSNKLLTFLSFVSFILLIKLTYRKGFTAIFAFIIVWQWIQITIKIFYANFIFKPVSEFVDTNSFEEAVIFSLLGLVALSSGIYFTTNKIESFHTEELRLETRYFSEKKLFLLWLIFSIFNSFIKEIMFRNMQLQQIFAGLLNFKMIIIASLLIVSFLNNRNKRYAYIVIITELLFGFTQYFSGFKEVLFYLIIINATLLPKINLRISFRYASLVGLVLVLGLIWTLIRDDYRKFLNQGIGKQVVVVPLNLRLTYLSNMLSTISFSNIKEGIEQTIMRTSYSDFFAQVMDRVPNYTYYEKGYLLYNTLKHIFMPRLFFPQKKSLDDSEITNIYTGRQYSGALQGTSIGIGYMAYYYIDFGKYLMLLFIFLQGVLYGIVYKYFYKKVKVKFLVYSITLPLFMGVYLYETSQPKIIGGLLSSFIILALSVRYLLRYFISYTIIKND